MKHTLFTIILLLLTIVIVKSQRNIFLIPRHINLVLPEIEIDDLIFTEYIKDENVSYNSWGNHEIFHFY